MEGIGFVTQTPENFTRTITDEISPCSVFQDLIETYNMPWNITYVRPVGSQQT